MAKHKILVVDDEESLCEILQFNLEVEGYEADVAYSAEQALRMHPERYSLILLDVMMQDQRARLPWLFRFCGRRDVRPARR